MDPFSHLSSAKKLLYLIENFFLFALVNTAAFLSER